MPVEREEARTLEALLIFGPLQQQMFLEWRYEQTGEALPPDFAWTYNTLYDALGTTVRTGFDIDASGMFVSTVTEAARAPARWKTGDRVHYPLMESVVPAMRKLVPGALIRITAAWATARGTPMPGSAVTWWTWWSTPREVTAVFEDTNGNVLRVAVPYGPVVREGDWMSSAVIDMHEVPFGLRSVKLVAIEVEAYEPPNVDGEDDTAPGYESAKDPAYPVMFMIEIAPQETRQRIVEERAARTYVEWCGPLVCYLRHIGRIVDPERREAPSIAAILAKFGQLAIRDALRPDVTPTMMEDIAAVAGYTSMWLGDDPSATNGFSKLDLVTSVTVPAVNPSGFIRHGMGRRARMPLGAAREPIARVLSVAMEEGCRIGILGAVDAHAVTRQREAAMLALLTPDEEPMPEKQMRFCDITAAISRLPSAHLPERLEYLRTYPDGSIALRLTGGVAPASTVVEDLQDASVIMDFDINALVWLETKLFGRAPILGLHDLMSPDLGDLVLGPYEDVPVETPDAVPEQFPTVGLAVPTDADGTQTVEAGRRAWEQRRRRWRASVRAGGLFASADGARVAGVHVGEGVYVGEPDDADTELPLDAVETEPATAIEDF